MSQKGVLFVWSLIGLLAFLTAACGGGETPPATTPNPSQSPTPLPVLTSSQVFSSVSPSVAFISTPTSSGSAILIKEGYLLTNSHVVHGFNKVRVVFPDGSVFLEVPVKNSDDLIDLAILGPIDTDIDPLKLEDREDLDIGSNVYLVGYPAEIDEFPQPRFTRGILSRIRRWEAIEMTYFQTDAAITGGQSGGALVSELGEIIGISGFRFSDTDFGLVASMADVAPLADALIDGRDASVLGSRPFAQGEGQRRQDFFLETPWDIRTFLIEVAVGSTVELNFRGRVPGIYSVFDPFGSLLLAGENGNPELESASFQIETEGRHSVSVGLSAGSEGQLTLSGNVNLIPAEDQDDGATLSIGDLVAGNLDYIGDIDYFLINLVEGETVEIRVESMNIDAELTVDFPESRPEQVLTNDDSGGGLSGTDSTMFYRPIRTGVHYLVVNDATVLNTGGYFISVDVAPEDAASVETPPIRETVDSPFGLMTIFNSPTSGFSVHAPADWNSTDIRQPTTELSIVDGSGNNMVVVVEDLIAVDLSETTLEEYSDLIVSLFAAQIPGFELLSRWNVQTTQGLDAVRLEYSALGGTYRGSRLIYLDESNVAINITLQAGLEAYEVLNEMFDYIFESFRFE